MERGWFPQLFPHSRHRNSYWGMGYSFFRAAGRRANQPYKRNPLFPEWKNRNEMQKNATHPEFHVPRFQERVGTWRSGEMILIRLPWRLRARPSATLHEI